MNKVRKRNPNRILKYHTKVYTVYEEKTDNVVIVDGTSSECIKKMKISLPAFYSAVSRYRKGIKGKWAFVVNEI